MRLKMKRRHGKQRERGGKECTNLSEMNFLTNWDRREGEREERKRDEEKDVYVTPREHDRTSLNARHLYFRFTARIFAAPDSF